MNKAHVYQKALESGEILKGTVRVVQFHPELNTDVLIVDLGGAKGIILRDDVDMEVNWKSLVGFVGRDILFKVKEVNKEKDYVLCSRKAAQLEMKEGIVERLTEGEVFSAQIVSILKYGAYVDIEGITGLLKNSDFAEDYTAVGDILKIGNKLNVRLKKTSSNGNLLFEAVQKYRNPTIMSFDIFEKDQVVPGVVRNVKPWGYYVNIAPSLDALCPPVPTGEVEEGTKVSVRITQVLKEDKRIRGKVVRIH